MKRRYLLHNICFVCKQNFIIYKDMSLSKLRELWWTGRPGVLWFMGSQRVGHDWVTELNELKNIISRIIWERKTLKLPFLLFWSLVLYKVGETRWIFEVTNTYCFYYLFVYFWLCLVFTALYGLSLYGKWGLVFYCNAQASHCGGLFCCGAQSPGHPASSRSGTRA